MNKKGFTLIELIVVVAILGGLSVAVSRIFFSNIKGAQRAQNQLELRQAGDSAMLNISKRLRNARSIPSAQCLGTPTSSITFSARDPEAPISSEKTVDMTILCSEIAEGSFNILNCGFTCQSVAGSPQRVDIYYALQDIKTSLTLEFNSTVTLRNY